MRKLLLHDERGAAIVLFAVVLTTILTLGAALVNLGNWWTHARHLQTKADAAALAAGGVWGFPCGPDSDTNINGDGILDTARTFFGSHTAAGPAPAAGTVVTADFNAQIGGVPGDDIHVVFNGTDYWDDDPPVAFEDMTSPLGQVCLAKIIDVKATEANSVPLFGFLPFWPDIKRKARVEIQEVEGISGLLPIGVRIPKPLSAAAIFYNEDSGLILGARYFCEDSTIFGLPPGLGGWSTMSSDATCTASADTSGWADFTPTEKTGVAIATSFRPRCGAGTPPAGPPCMNVSSALVNTPVNDFCRGAGGTIQCDFANGTGSGQSVVNGLHFIRGYPGGGAPDGPPQLRGAYLSNVSCNPGNGYFNSGANSACTTALTVQVDLGSVLEDIPPTPPNTPEESRTAGNFEVRYKLFRDNGTSFCDYGPNCSLQKSVPDNATDTVSFTTQGSPSSPHVPLATSSRVNAVAIEVRMKGSSADPNPGGCGPAQGFSNNCRWFYTGNGGGPVSNSVEPPAATVLGAPVQRAFMGNINTSGPIRWLRLTQDPDCDGLPPILIDNDAATHSSGSPGCFFMDMGLQGGIARDQDEPAIALNLGTGSSQRALLDCDDVPMSNITNEIKNGCTPTYATNPFTINNGAGPFCPNVNSINGLLSVPKPAPFDDWPPYTCVITQTGTGNQVMFGFNQRLFGSNNAPNNCPLETSDFVPGRNYWHDANNANDLYTFAQDNPAPPRRNRLRDDDPRLVTLFFTPYDSFTASGNEPFPVVGFGNFYITGYGRTTGGGWQGGGPEDPCDEGNVGNPLDGLPFGVGNEPPPDLDLGDNEAWVWGHFVSNVVPGPRGTPSGVLCNPEASFQPCIPSLVE